VGTRRNAMSSSKGGKGMNSKGSSSTSSSSKSNSHHSSDDTSRTSRYEESSSKVGKGMSSKSSNSRHSSDDNIFAADQLHADSPVMSPTMSELFSREDTVFAPSLAGAPVPAPHDLPTLPNTHCVTDNGAFGLQEGQEEIIVKFRYDVTLDDQQNMTENDFMEQVLPGLEIALNDAVVPTLFAKACNRSNRILLERHGLNAEPVDKVQNSCGGNCYSVLGQITMFLSETTATAQTKSLQEDATLFRQTLQTSMNDKQLFDNRSPIRSVKYVPSEFDKDDYAGDVNSNNRDIGMDDEPATSNSSKGDVHKIVLISWFSFFGLLVIAAVIYIIRRFRKQARDEQMQQQLQR